MINAIGEAALQQSLRPQANAPAQSEQALARESERLREERPVEKTDDSHKPKLDTDSDAQPETTSRNRIEDGEVIVEQYDENGQLLKLSPPGYLPLSETV